MIELKHISKTFPTADGVFQALDDINLTIRDGALGRLDRKSVV